MDNISIIDLRHGNRDSFEYVYTRYYKELFRFAYNYVLCDEAEDIVQDVFVKLYENRKHLSPDINIRAYLYSSTKNRCLNFHRHLGIMDNNETRIIETLLRCEEHDAEEAEQIYNTLEDGMSELSIQQRTILEMKAKGDDYKQIANALNISQGSVNTHISRAYNYLRKKFIYFFFILCI